MSILEKSEQIGLELKNTVEGSRALELYMSISQYPVDITHDFFRLIDHHYIKFHFFSVQHVLGLLKENEDNELLGNQIKKLLDIKEIHSFAAANNPIGEFVEKLSKSAFGNEVKYELPREVSFTPKLVRLSNSLTVECLRTKVLQCFLKEYKQNPKFAIAIKRFDELRGRKPIVPYSKEDRRILCILKSEFGNQCQIELIYTIVTMMSYIKGMIFDAFYDNIFEIYEETDVIIRKQKRLMNCVYNRLILNPDKSILFPQKGWILKIHNIDGSTSYGQVFEKSVHWNKESITVKLDALVFDML